MTPDDRAKARGLLAAEDWSAARAWLENHAPSTDDADWFAFRAEVEAGAGELDDALAFYQRALEANHTHRAALYNASLVLSDLGRHDEAMEHLERLIEVEGETAETLNDLSYEYTHAGHGVPALLAATRAEQLATDPEMRWTARYNAAASLAEMGRRDEALARLDAMLADWSDECGDRGDVVSLREELTRPRRQPRAAPPAPPSSSSSSS